MAYFDWVTQKSANGSRTYLCIRASSGKVLEWLGRHPTTQQIRAAAERHDVAIARSATTKKEE